MYFKLMKSFQDIVCERIIRDISKTIKNAINEAFDFSSVDNSSVQRVKILSDIAKEEAKWVELENSDIIKVLEGLYGITRPRGFKVGKEVVPNNEKKREVPAIYTTNNNGKADRELQEILKAKGFTFCGRKPYREVVDGEITIDDQIKNSWWYKNFEIEQYQLVISKQITINEYKKIVKNEYDIKYKNIENSIKKWQDEYNNLPEFAKDIYDEYNPIAIGISPDEGIIYLNITNYNDNDKTFVTFTGKVLYIVNDLITDKESKKLNDDKKIYNGKFTCLNVALRKNKYSLAYNSVKYMKNGAPTYLDFFDWDISCERIKKKALQGLDIPYMAHQMELMTQKHHWHKVEPTHGATFEYHTNDNLCYYRVYKKKDEPQFMKNFVDQFEDKSHVLLYRPADQGSIKDKIPNAYVEIGILEDRLKDYKYWN